MIFEPKIMGNKKMKVYCATCKKEIKCKDKLAFSTTKTGVLKIHHQICGIIFLNIDDPKKLKAFKKAYEKQKS